MIRLLLIVILLLPSLALAVGAPDFVPDGAHPRIWLTTEEMTRLNAKQTSGSEDWTSLESWCDAHISDTGYDAGDVNWKGYRMSGYSKYLINYSLAYQVLKDDNPAKAAIYAAFVRNILVNGIAVGLRSGEENNGLKAPRCGESNDRSISTAEATALGIDSVSYKLGYANRNLASVPIAYDWIYSTLSASDKQVLIAMMYRWFDWTQGVRSVYNNGVLVNGTRYHEDQNGTCAAPNVCTSFTGSATQGYNWLKMGGNFMGGHVYMMSLIPIATYGDSADAPAYLSAWKNVLTSTVIAQLESPLKQSGGDAVEGWNYGGGFIYAVQGLYGYYTATGDTSVASMAWPHDLAKALIHRLGANLLDVPLYGDWTGTPYGQNRKYITLPIMGVEQRLSPGSDYAKVGKYLLANVTYSDNVDEWASVLWDRSDIPAVSPASLPLDYIAKGNGLLTSRSGWDSGAVSLSVRLEGKHTQSHEGYDEGHISLQRGADRLLAHQNMSSPSVAYNTIVFGNSSHHDLNPLQTVPSMDRSESGNGYVYVSGDVTNAWKRQYQSDRAKLFRRSVLHLSPGIVVAYDVTRANTAFSNLKEAFWQFTADPTETGNIINATVGSSKIAVMELFPSGTFTETAQGSGFWRVKYTPSTTQEYDQFLHVISATGSGNQQISADLVDGSGGRGAEIGGNTVVMFTKDPDGSNITSLSYSAETTGVSTHYIADLIPGATYAVSIDGGTPANYTASSAGLLIFSNPTASSHTYSIMQSGVALPPTTSALPASGTYAAGQSVTLASTGSAIKYCLFAGCNPTTDYVNPINISSSTVLRFYGVGTEGNEAVKTETYTIELPTTTTVSSARASGRYTYR